MIKAHFKRNAIPFIASILLLAVGLWLDVKWFSHRPVMLFYLINLLPGLSLLLTWFLASRSPKRRWLCFGLGLLTTLFALIVMFYANLGVMMVVSATTPIRDTARYEEILTEYEEELAAHFPRHIPDSATNVTFYYLPRFMQGGSYLQLRCRLRASEASAVLQQYRPVAKRVENGLGEVIEANEQTYLPAISFRNEENTEFAPLPDDFLVLVLDAEPSEPGNWNHGYTYGVAISEQRQEVIYWAEYW